MTAPAAPRPGASPRGASRPTRRHWGRWLFLILIVLPAALFALWTWVALHYTYSRGDRTGYNQKISLKGFVCKTWEGELAITNVPGQAPQLFDYTVRDDAVAQRIRQLDGQRVTLIYSQHLGLPTRCFGETQYFVDSVRAAPAAAFPGYGPAPSPAAPGAVPGQAPSATPAAPSTTPPAASPR